MCINVCVRVCARIRISVKWYKEQLPVKSPTDLEQITFINIYINVYKCQLLNNTCHLREGVDIYIYFYVENGGKKVFYITL